MKMMFLVAFLFLHAESIEGYEFRLLTTNSQGTEGFVEMFYNGSWGFVGHEEFQFSDDTATLLCRKFNLSLFGYGASDTFQEKFQIRYFWLQKLECNGNKPSIDECIKTDELRLTHNVDDYGSKLYCVDYRLMGGLSPNTGMLLAAFSSTQQSMCYQGFDSSAGEVVCKHLRYNGLVAFTEGDPGSIPLFNNKLTCTGNERSLHECTMSNAVIENCTRAVYITCKVVRLITWNEYNDEGTVEIFYKGSWGSFRSDERFNDETAKNLCETFGFRNVGFSSGRDILKAHDGKGWFGTLSCNGTEADIMQCRGPSSFIFEQLQHFLEHIYHENWLYCIDFNVTSMRLVNGLNPNEGFVELQIGGRWGSIYMDDQRNYLQVETVGRVVCKILGYVGLSRINHLRVLDYNKYIWMSILSCNGNEIDLTDCSFRKGGLSSNFLAVKCKDTDQCQSNPCLNNGTCVDGDRSYTCTCTERWSGINCEIDIDECLSQPCENNGACVKEINGFVCYCDQGYEGYRCQNEIGDDQTTLIVVLISSICVLSFVVFATVCCCLRYRKEHKQTSKKTKSDASNVLNRGRGGLQNTKQVEAVQTEMGEGQYNEDVYDGIQENTVTDVADYVNPVHNVELPRDADGYVKFADNDQSVGYYKLKHTKAEDYSKFSGYKF